MRLKMPIANRSAQRKIVYFVGRFEGAVPIIWAIAPIAAGLEDAEVIFNVVFLIVLLSVSIQGFALDPVARYLKLAR